MNKNLDASDAADVEYAGRKREKPKFRYKEAKEDVRELNLNANETAKFLDSINNRITEHKIRMERLKRLEQSL